MKPTDPRTNERVGSPRHRHTWHRVASLASLALAAALGLGSLACYVGYRVDRIELRQRSQEIVWNVHDPSEKVLALNTWIHRVLKTAKNESYFGISRLRATPLQVLHGGGDCADKARLLAAMLHEIDIPASMALCFHPETGQPSHTVVNAEPKPDAHMLVDPAYELFYPKPDGHGYYGLLELRKHPERLQERLTYVWETVPRFRPLHWYNPQIASFSGLSTVNWRRNRITALAHDVLFLFVGPDIYQLPRPAMLEAPKLAVAGIFAFLALITLAGQFAVNRSSSHRLSRTRVADKKHCLRQPPRPRAAAAAIAP